MFRLLNTAKISGKSWETPSTESCAHGAESYGNVRPIVVADSRTEKIQMPSNTEMDALLVRVREVSRPSTSLGRSLRFDEVARDCLRMFDDLVTRYKEEFAMRDRYKAQSNSWRDKALGLAEKIAWKPIETAPRDGNTVLIAHNHWGTVNVTLAAWGRVNYGAGQFEDGWRSYSGFLTGAKWWCDIPSVEALQTEENVKEDSAQALNRLSQ